MFPMVEMQPQISKEKQIAQGCYVFTTTADTSNGIFVAATNSTNQTNKAGGTCH